MVDAFDPRLLVATSISHIIDFTKTKVFPYMVLAVSYTYFFWLAKTYVFDEGETTVILKLHANP